jgi:hypothetical protein
MHRITILRWTIAGGMAAAMSIGANAAMAQTRVYPPGTDCSLLPQNQQIDCHIQQENSTMTPGGSALPAGNGTGTNQDGTLKPNGSSRQTGGNSLGAGGSGGASPPGQSGN